MRNVTIALEEDVARWIRVWAAEHDTSVSRFVGDLLKAKMTNEREYRRAQKRFMGRSSKLLKASGTYPRRDELHERDLLR